ncbi:hypothetical protein [Ralstonia mannitolilytica]|uniref:Uncharacterized protein n=1 Tax=Ralstonia mannitolilytica TaxID=105219 RepID=A0AAD2B373_9RALS|nr:hypothetical protein [Ralstonia mannitolilytica]MBY4721437.1 hypothetical protein [Ralstonia mannitolilytica]CAJ0698007.1 hypothetical protein R77591_04901 [Ralstonia mannitolilytica]
MMATLTPSQEHAQKKRDIAQAQQEIQAAVQRTWPCFYEKPMKNEVGSDSCHKLSHLQIGMGVRALSLVCNLRGGSTGDIDLYQLIRAYFWDQDARRRINEIVAASLAPKH